MPVVMGCQSKSIDQQAVASVSALANKTSEQVYLVQIDKAARTELKDVDKRLTRREKAVNNLNWGSKSDEAVYKERLTELKAQRAALVESIDRLNSYEPTP